MAANASASVVASRTTRMPAPPVPASGLISTGKFGTEPGSTNVGSTGTRASATSVLVSLLLRSVASVWAGAPTQIRPASVTAAAKSGSSASTPVPGWMALAPVRWAAVMIRSPRR